MTISAVSQKYYISPDTLRYYEKEGLLPQIQHDNCGRRDYTTEDCQRLELIICLRNTGLPLAEIQKIVTSDTSSSDNTLAWKPQKQILETQREKLCAQIRELENCIDFLDLIVQHNQYGTDLHEAI